MTRGFLFTIDGFASLLFAVALLSLVALFSPWNADYSRQFHYPQLARDYLQVRYGNNISSLTPQVFFGMTGVNLTETQPSSGDWARGEKIVYGNVANCANASSCSFSNTSSQAAFLNASDLGLASTRFAWVKP